MKKRILAMLLVLLMTLSLIPASVFADETTPTETTPVVTEPAATTAPSEPAATTAPSEPAATTAPSEPAATTAPSEPAATTAPSEPAATEIPKTTEPLMMAPMPEVLTIVDRLLATETISEFWNTLLDFENYSDVLALTLDEIATVKAHLTAIYEALENPTDEEISDYNELIETLDSLPANACSECGEIGGHLEDCTKFTLILAQGDISGTITGEALLAARNSSNTVRLVGNVSLTSQIVLTSTDKLILDLNGYVLNVTGASRAIFCNGGEVTIRDSNPSRKHNGRLVEVVSWLDKRLNHSSARFGTTYNVADTNKFADRYYLDYHDGTHDYSGGNELWVYDESGDTTISGGIITGGKADYYQVEKSNYSGGGAIYMLGGKLTIEGGTIAGCAAYRFFNANGDGKIPSSIPTTWYQGHAYRNSNPNGGAIMCNGGASFTMNGGSIMYNWADYCGGGVYTTGSGTVFTMNGGKITDNCTRGEGGGIAVRSGSVFNFGPGSSVPVISLNKTFDSNYTGGGGGISVSGAVINFQNGKIESNRANGSGGGIYCYRGGSVTASASSVISGNTAGGNGGGIYIQYGTVTLNGSTVASNTAGNAGGAVSTRVASFVMNGGTLRNNTAKTGGAVNLTAQNNIGTHRDNGNLGSSASLTNAKIYENKATSGNGGALYVDVMNSSDNMTVTVDSCEIYSNTATSSGGAICLLGGALTVEGSTNVHDNSAKNGGAFYVADKTRNDAYYVNTDQLPAKYSLNEGGWWEGGEIADYVTKYTDTKPGVVVIKSGTFSNNKATTGSGGVLYLTGTQSSVEVQGGTMTNNSAKQHGGAIYSNGGNYTMLNGTISNNSATQNGGAVYVKGNVTIKHGILNENTAQNGGAVYMAGTTSTTFVMESGQMKDNKATTDGGAVCAENGNITFGLEDCTKETSLHTSPCHHPDVLNNTAGNCGGGVALVGNGNVIMYCGTVDTNNAQNAGRGLNVYMKSGNFYYHKGADVGKPSAPELVVIGGEVFDYSKDTNNKITLNYHHCNITGCVHTGDKAVKKATATAGTTINLPDAEYYWTAEQGMRAFGWSFASDSDPGTFVRKTSDYLPLGEEITVDADHANIYALWAPVNNKISYKGAVIDGVYKESESLTPANVTNYQMPEAAAGTDITLNNPVKPGYTFNGWYFYQDENQNANWGHEPVYNTGKTALDFANWTTNGGYFLTAGTSTVTLNIPQHTFGDVTLIAKFTEDSVTINYKLVGDIAGAVLSLNTETVKRDTGNPTGSEVTGLKAGYEFVGWFSDEACTQQVGTDEKFVPQKANDGLYAEATYYAKVQLALVDIEIHLDAKINSAIEPVPIKLVGTADNTQIGNVTLELAFTDGNSMIVVKDVPVGTYTVVSQKYWNWRYKDNITTSLIDNSTGALPANIKDTNNRKFLVGFGDKVNNQWLNGYDAIVYPEK